MKTLSLLGLAILVLAWGAALPRAIDQVPVARAAASNAPVADPDKPSPAGNEAQTVPPALKTVTTVPSPPRTVSEDKISLGIREIVNMVEKGIDAAIIKSYIENSGIAYNPGVYEILYLHEHGVPSDLIATIIKHGGLVRAQHAQAAKEMQGKIAEQRQAAAAAAAPAPAPAPVQTPPVTQNYFVNYPASYGASYPTYVAPAYPVYYSSYRYRSPIVPYYSSCATYPSYSLFNHYRPYYTVYPRYSFGLGYRGFFNNNSSIRISAHAAGLNTGRAAAYRYP